MLETIIAAAPGEEVVESNALATVTTNCLVIRNPDGKSQTIILLSRLSQIRKATTIYPGLLVVAVGLGIISAACMCSKQGHGAAVPTAGLALLFFLGYLAHRRASIAFSTGSGAAITPDGAVSEADAVIKAVQQACKSTESVQPSADPPQQNEA